MINKPGKPERPRCVITKPSLPGQQPQMKCYPPQKAAPRQFVAALVLGPPPAPVAGFPLAGVTSGIAGSTPGPAPSPTPTPTPTPGPGGCVVPSFFQECFALCSGTIPPDPEVCGWTPDGGTGTLTFSPGQVLIDTTFIARMRKTIPNPVSLFGITGQYRFQEFNSLTANDFYDFSIEDTGQVNGLDLFLDGSGFVYFQVGPILSAPFYNGVWTPNMGEHVVHYNVSPAGVPTIWIDGVLIPMVLSGNQANFANAPSNAINGEFGRNAPGNPAAVFNYFLTSGELSPTTEFCCA